jgi:hypothetical protein
MNSYEYQTIRGMGRKLYLIDQRGGKCEKCGYCENLGSLDFHHRDSNEKEGKLDMRTLSNSTMKWILLEFEKCQVLCSNCHRETHYPDLNINLVRTKVSEFNNYLKDRSVNLPRCVDCDKPVNYKSIRCRECKCKSTRKIGRPTIDILLEEVRLNGRKYCANKYQVTVRTIGKWLIL